VVIEEQHPAGLHALGRGEEGGRIGLGEAHQKGDPQRLEPAVHAVVAAEARPVDGVAVGQTARANPGRGLLHQGLGAGEEADHPGVEAGAQGLDRGLGAKAGRHRAKEGRLAHAAGLKAVGDRIGQHEVGPVGLPGAGQQVKEGLGIIANEHATDVEQHQIDQWAPPGATE
jgi:hypothetical protein